jgi:hypothetical protein
MVSVIRRVSGPATFGADSALFCTQKINDRPHRNRWQPAGEPAD